MVSIARHSVIGSLLQQSSVAQVIVRDIYLESTSMCKQQALYIAMQLYFRVFKVTVYQYLITIVEVKMRVRIQYKTHRHLLTGIESVKDSHEERQLDKYFQAANIMRSRDTGCVVCNISFSDITYLGAFWRDYSNGALQEALRGVFLTGIFCVTGFHVE